MPPLPHLTALRYVQPLREGGSLPAVVDTNEGLFVVKFRGAGQGPKALIAELIVGRIAERIGLPVPTLAVVDVQPAFGRSEPDPEIQELLRRSHGLNVGLAYLDGAFNFDARAAEAVIDAEFASLLVWLDAFVTNPDRTDRNPNLLVWNRRAWLIDHGAALYLHHDWSAGDAARARAPFPLIAQHVLLESASKLDWADARATAALSADALEEIVAVVPDALLLDVEGRHDVPPEAARARYSRYLNERIQTPRTFLASATEARTARMASTPERRLARR